jgi:glycine hydroxymethyltransferase
MTGNARAAGPHAGYFTDPLAVTDPAVAAALDGEMHRQQEQVELIASENLVSRASLEAIGSVIVNKTVEGYPGKRYYGGAEFADVLESLAIERAKELFGCAFANVQPHSGSQANQAVYLALLKAGETFLAMDLQAGGHLSHGARPNLTGKWLHPVHYGLGADGQIDYGAVEALAREHRPRLIITGGSAYARAIDFPRMRAIADQVEAPLLVDMAHFAGLVAAGVHPDPFPHAHVVTATTYKNLRGVRGGLILTNDGDLAKRLDTAVFPGIQGSVILNTIAAKAVCLGEPLRPEFKVWAQAVLDNARGLAAAHEERGLPIVGGGTDTPLMLIDLRPKGLTGDVAQDALEMAGLACNKNAVPGDEQPPTVTSGLRFGVSAMTTRGFDGDEIKAIGGWIADVLDGLAAGDDRTAEVAEKIGDLCRRFPIYPDIG